MAHGPKIQKILIEAQSIYCTVVAWESWDGQCGTWQFHAVQVITKPMTIATAECHRFGFLKF